MSKDDPWLHLYRYRLSLNRSRYNPSNPDIPKPKIRSLEYLYLIAILGIIVIGVIKFVLP